MRFLVSLMMKNPMIVKGLEPFVQGIIVDFGVQIQAILSVLSGEYTPSELLPFQMPADMEKVEQEEDVPLDMLCYKDKLDHVYDFDYGMDFEKRIEDERVKYLK